jgi:hypothetical protein
LVFGQTGAGGSESPAIGVDGRELLVAWWRANPGAPWVRVAKVGWDIRHTACGANFWSVTFVGFFGVCRPDTLTSNSDRSNQERAGRKKPARLHSR